MNVADVLQAVRNPFPQKLFGFRSGLGLPMEREGTVIGAIAVSRSTVGPFRKRRWSSSRPSRRGF